MKINWKLFATAVMISGAFLVGCNKPSADTAATQEHHEGDGHDHGAHEGHDHGDHAGHDHGTGSLLDLDNPSTPAPADAAEFVVGCATCNMGLEGDSCATAIKVDGKAYYTSGVSINAHAIGLCKAPAKAKVAGKLEGDKFAVTGFTLLPKAE